MHLSLGDGNRGWMLAINNGVAIGKPSPLC